MSNGRGSTHVEAETEPGEHRQEPGEWKQNLRFGATRRATKRAFGFRETSFFDERSR
jgi:hypothetical protein